MSQSRNTKDLISTAERRQYLLERRRAGDTYREMVEKARAMFGKEGLPAGFDKRYAKKDLNRLLEQLREDNRETAEEVRQLELMRLDRMMSGLWNAAKGGDEKAVQKVLNIMERRARYLGLDAAEEIEQTVSVLQSEDYQALRSTIMDVLEDHPDARADIAKALSRDE